MWWLTKMMVGVDRGSTNRARSSRIVRGPPGRSPRTARRGSLGSARGARVGLARHHDPESLRGSGARQVTIGRDELAIAGPLAGQHERRGELTRIGSAKRVLREQVLGAIANEIDICDLRPDASQGADAG